jgi:hypothetical protein
LRISSSGFDEWGDFWHLELKNKDTVNAKRIIKTAYTPAAYLFERFLVRSILGLYNL